MGVFSDAETRHKFILACTLALTGTLAQAADPQPYTVVIGKTGDAVLDQALRDSSSLISLDKAAPVGPFALVARAQNDLERFAAALDSLGFYQAKLQLRIAGRALDDSSLDDWLDHAPAEPPVEISVAVEPGPLFHLRTIDIQGEIPDSVRAQLGLSAGAPALAKDVLAGRESLLNALRNEGYALAKVEEPDASLVPESAALDVVYKVETGPRVDLGQIQVNGLKSVDEAFVRRRLLVAGGDSFNPEAIEKARQDIAATGVFASVRAQAAETVDSHGHLPIRFDLVERPKHSTSLGAAWSTDLGGSLSATWQHRNLFGNAEQLNLTTGVTQLGGKSATGIGYKLLAGFVKPDVWQRDQSLRIDFGAVKQSLIAYDQKAITGAISLNRKISEYWQASLGLNGEHSQITQAGATHDYTLLSLPMALKYDSSNHLLDPTAGIRASASLTPYQALTGQRRSTFVVFQLSGSAYWNLGEPGRSVLALRGTVGDVEGAGQFDLPPDKRFYGGGSATVRGFQYQSIGPQFADHKPQGGTALSAASVEFRQRILADYGAVVFADVGQVNGDGLPFVGTWRMGAGVGARYYTGFGPIRLDVAIPVNRQAGGGWFEVYIGLGQAF